MNTSLTTTTLLSTYQWLDWYLLQKGQLYTNTVSRFYPRTDSQLGAGYQTFASPFRSFVWDSGVSGAQIFNSVSGYLFDASAYASSGSSNVYSGVLFPQVGITGMNGNVLQIDFGTGAYISIVAGSGVQSGNSVFFSDNLLQTGIVRISGVGQPGYDDITVIISGTPIVINRGELGMNTDFVNGRALFPVGAIPPNAIISGSYAFKGFNLYFANQGADRMVFSDKYYLNSRFGHPITGVPPPYEMVTPAIFISATENRNRQLALGGQMDTQIGITLNVMAETQGQLESAMSLLAASRDLTFPQLPSSAWPLNSIGDYKSGYNYVALRASYRDQPFYSITRASAHTVSDVAKIDQSIFLGEVRLTLDIPRFLR